MSLEADEAGGRTSGRRLPPVLPASSQLNSRSLSGPPFDSVVLLFRVTDETHVVPYGGRKATLP